MKLLVVDKNCYVARLENCTQSRDLSHAYSFLQIAEIYRQAGQREKALDWAEQGMKSFSKRDSRLVEFLAREYQRLARHDDAMKLIWHEFIETPFLKNY